MPRLKPLVLNLLLLAGLVVSNVAIWRLMLGYFPDLSQVAAVSLGLAGMLAFYIVYFQRRSCGHGRITEGGRHMWWPRVVNRCPECGDEV